MFYSLNYKYSILLRINANIVKGKYFFIKRNISFGYLITKNAHGLLN